MLVNKLSTIILTINGNGQLIEFNPKAGINSEKRVIGFNKGSKHIVLDSLTIKGDYGYGIAFGDSVSDIIIRNCNIRMTYSSQYNECAGIAFVDCSGRHTFSCNNKSSPKPTLL